MTEHCSEIRGGGRRISADAETRQQIAEEHRALGELLGRLEATRDPHALLPRLEELERLLKSHFQREEGAEGLHEMVGESAPHMLTSVQRLFEEHREMAARLDELIRETRRCIEGPVAQVLTGASDLACRLRDHEQAENELVAGALYEDLGISS